MSETKKRKVHLTFPAEHGYLGHPTILNNVKTLCAVDHIALHGGAWWATIGTPRSTVAKIHPTQRQVRIAAFAYSPVHLSVDLICGCRLCRPTPVGCPVWLNVHPVIRLRATVIPQQREHLLDASYQNGPQASALSVMAPDHQPWVGILTFRPWTSPSCCRAPTQLEPEWFTAAATPA